MTIRFFSRFLLILTLNCFFFFFFKRFLTIIFQFRRLFDVELLGRMCRILLCFDTNKMPNFDQFVVKWPDAVNGAILSFFVYSFFFRFSLILTIFLLFIFECNKFSSVFVQHQLLIATDLSVQFKTPLSRSISFKCHSKCYTQSSLASKVYTFISEIKFIESIR